jgi:uncharacterized repeat protein (TIGR02543 family)
MKTVFRNICASIISLGIAVCVIPQQQLTVRAMNAQNSIFPIEESQGLVTLTYNGNADDAQNIPENQSGTVGTIIQISDAAPVRAGYIFSCWSIQADGGGNVYQTGESITLDTDITLYAQWQKDTQKQATYEQTLQAEYNGYTLKLSGKLPDQSVLTADAVSSSAGVEAKLTGLFVNQYTYKIIQSFHLNVGYGNEIFSLSGMQENDELQITGDIPTASEGDPGYRAYSFAEDGSVNEITDAQFQLNSVVLNSTDLSDIVIVYLTESIEDHPTGYITSPRDTNVLSVSEDADYHSSYRMLRASALPSSYRTADLPRVRDQSPYGACWAFSTLGLMEMSLIKQNYSLDLSEFNLAYYAWNSNLDGVDPLGGTTGDTMKMNSSLGYMNYGGNYDIAAQTLMNWSGAVLETTAPYPAEGKDLSTLTKGAQYTDDVTHLKEAYALSLSGDRELVKKAIQDNGGVGISIDYESEFYNAKTYAFYCGYTDRDINHAVTIVGWDDNFAASNFTSSNSTSPSANGAWLIRNSWGDNDNTYSAAGYFWLSYENHSMNDTAYVFKADETMYSNNYQYDGNNYYSAGYYEESVPSVTAANIFTAKANTGGTESLKAVTIDLVYMVNAGYQIDIYRDLTDSANPESGEKVTAAETSGTLTAEGYYTIPLNNEVMLNEGSKFSVVVTLSKSSGNAYFAIESSSPSGLSDYTATASSAAGQSFVKSGTSWTDEGASGDGNFRIKALTDNVATTTLTLTGTTSSYDLSDTRKILLYKTGLIDEQSVKSDAESDTPSKYAYSAVSGTGSKEETFQFENVPTGVYYLAIAQNGKHATRVEKVEVKADSSNLGTYKIWLYGDTMDLGEVSQMDAIEVLKYSLGRNGSLKRQTDGMAIKAADVDGNGSVEAFDAIEILKYCFDRNSVFKKMK